MVQSIARVVTDQPDRYLKQLVSHLSHRLTTRVEADGTGVLEWDTAAGRCLLAAQAGVLVLTASAEDEAMLQRVRDVVARHLERFGGRKGLDVTWSETR
jgi:hypothetical protein